MNFPSQHQSLTDSLMNIDMSQQDLTVYSQEEAKGDAVKRTDYNMKRSYVNHDIDKKYLLVQVIEEEGITIKEAA
jgi:hypothetical protein